MAMSRQSSTVSLVAAAGAAGAGAAGGCGAPGGSAARAAAKSSSRAVSAAGARRILIRSLPGQIAYEDYRTAEGLGKQRPKPAEIG
jgi:hypothetical protein